MLRRLRATWVPALAAALFAVTAPAWAAGHVVISQVYGGGGNSDATPAGSGALINIDPDGTGPAAPRALVLLKNPSCASALVPGNLVFPAPAVSRGITKSQALRAQ